MTKPTGKPRGRPPTGKAATKTLGSVRVTDELMQSCKECADLEGSTFAGWVRTELERAVKRVRKKHRQG